VPDQPMQGPTPLPYNPQDWNQAPLEESQVDVTGGVYSSIEPFYIQPNQLYYLKNADLDTLGKRSKRRGVYSIGSPSATYPHGMGTWVTDDKTRYLIGMWNNQPYKTTGDLSWASVGSGSYSLPGTGMYNAIQGRGFFYVGSATIAESALFIHGVEPYTDTTLPPLWIIPESGDETMQASYCPRAVTWWQGRLWMGNLSCPDFGPDTLVWSDILDGVTIDPTNNIEIDPDKGDEIMAIVPTRSSDPRLYIFKRNSIYALDVVWGSGAYVPTTENTLDTTNSRVVLLSAKIGCVAPKTITYGSGSGNSDIFFLARDGLRSLKRVEQDTAGGAGEAVSEPIKDVIDRINWAYAHKSVAAIWDHKLYLSIPVDGATSVNYTAVFDLIRKVWIGYYDITGVDLIDFDFNDSQRKLYTQWGVVTTENLAGTNATQAAHCFELFRADEFYNPSFATVEFEEQTRAFTFGNYGLKKKWNWLEMIFDPSESAVTVEITAKVDEYAWMTVSNDSIEADFEYPILPDPLPWTFQDQQPQTERYNLMDLPPGHKLQIKIVTTTPADFALRTTRVTAWPYSENWE